MAPTHSSLSGDRSRNEGNQPHGTSPGGAATHGGESFTISGSKTAENELKLKVSLPFTADDQVNPIPLMEMLLKTALLFDPTSSIKSNNPLCSSIDKVDDIAKIPATNVEKYVMDLQTVAAKKQFVFFITLKTNAAFHRLKFNRQLFNWLTENNYWITFHGMNTNFPISLGWFMGVHPTLSSRDAMSEHLSQYFEMEDIEFHLITTGQFYISDDKKKVTTKVVELHVDATDAERTRDLLSRLWLDPTFTTELEKRSVGMPIEFISSIQRGVMDVPTFRECLRRHREFAENTVAVSVVGIGGLDVVIKRMGKNITLNKMIKQLQDNGKPLFSGIEPTKLTNEEGRYLLLTQKDIIDKAEAKFDTLIENLAKEGVLDQFQIEGKYIRRVNQIQSKAVSAYAASIKARFKPMDTVQVPPMNQRPSTPTRNAWKRTPSLKYTQENFPALARDVTPTRRHADKKQRTANGSQTVNTDNAADDSSLSPPSLGTTQTELTDERTEFHMTITNMQTSFAEELRKIKAANEKDRKAAEERSKQSEQEYNQAKETMLNEFKMVDEKYTKVLESFSSLRTDLSTAKMEQDQRHMGMKESFGAMMQILVNINQSLANGTHPEPLQQEHIASIMNNIREPNRDGVPGSGPTERNSADLQGGGRKE